MNNNDPADTKTTAPKAKETEKKARVRVTKHRLRIGNFIHAQGSITTISVEEFELRRKSGEVELINLI